jgi:hypothetical protein
MPKKLERFYFTQDGATEGPYLTRQIQWMLRQGLIRADAIIKSENGASGDVDSFLKEYGWTETNDELGVAERQLFWIRRIGLAVVILSSMLLLFGIRIFEIK